MAENSKIQWTDHTLNSWVGCEKVSPACKNCYAEAIVERFGRDFKKRSRTTEATWQKALRWNSRSSDFFECSGCGCRGYKSTWIKDIRKTHPTALACCPDNNLAPARQRVFCLSMGDWLDDEVPIEWLADLLKLIHDTPNLDWLLLTKRPENWRGRIDSAFAFLANDRNEPKLMNWLAAWMGTIEIAIPGQQPEPPSNVWIGTTVENQEYADKRIPELLKIPAKVRFLSVEPMLGPVDLTMVAPYVLCGDESNPGYHNALNGMCYHPLTCQQNWKEPGPDGVHWVIAGGESGAGARPMQLEWATNLREQCKSAGVPFFFKQIGGVRNKRGELSDFPTELQVREFPSTNP